MEDFSSEILTTTKSKTDSKADLIHALNETFASSTDLSLKHLCDRKLRLIIESIKLEDVEG